MFKKKEPFVKLTPLTTRQARWLQSLGVKGIDFWRNGEVLNAPTQYEVGEWLRINHNLWIEVYSNASGFGYIISKADLGSIFREITDDIFYDTPGEAYSKALDIVRLELVQGENY
jgi:hypothetical protein